MHSCMMLLLFTSPLLYLVLAFHGGLLWAWYAFLCLFGAAGNLALVAFTWHRVHASDRYGRWMKLLCLPWVWECAWRSVFPALYLQRFVFWDTPLNSVIVNRSWACIGELSFQCQVALALMHVDRDIARRAGRRCRCWVQGSALLSVLVYMVAEFVSYYNVATTNEWWAAAEVFVDALAFVIVAPAAIVLLCKCPGDIGSSSAKLYCLALSIYCVAFPAYNFLVDCPMYLARYQEDQRNHKHYLNFVEGIKDAATRRIVTHHVEDWEQDMLWMSLYFVFGAWAGIALMHAPRLLDPVNCAPDSGNGARTAMIGDKTDADPSHATNAEICVEIEHLQTRLGTLQAEVLRRLAVV